MTKLYDATRVLAWREAEVRKTELSCPECDSNHLMIQKCEDNQHDEEHESIVECPICKSGLFLTEKPNHELEPWLNTGNNNRYRSEIHV